MTLSIIVPTYNVEAYLANCLESLVNQGLSAKEYEILVINDGSTDTSPQIAEAYANQYEQITVFHQENQGLSGARNQGIQRAKGAYIYFIDSDDYLAHNTLPYALQVMKDHNLDMLGLSVLTTPELDRHACQNPGVMKTESLKPTDGLTYLAENRYLNNAWWYILRKDYLDESGLTFPIGRYFEDCIFTATLIAHSKRIAQSSLDFYRYVVRGDSIMNRKSREHALRLIADYEKNVYDMQPLVDEVRNSARVEAPGALDRLEARQHSFIFFMLVLCIRNQLSKAEVAPILKRLSDFRAYPINRAFIKDYRNRAYPYLRFVMNRPGLFYLSLKFLPFAQRFMPGIYMRINRAVRMAS